LPAKIACRITLGALWTCSHEVFALSERAIQRAGLVFAPSILDAGAGAVLASVALPSGFTLASAPAVVDGTAVLGAGSGKRSGDPTDVANITSHEPQPITALCVGGTPDCDPAPSDRCDEGGSAPR
jgi:hypothetical protein